MKPRTRSDTGSRHPRRGRPRSEKSRDAILAATSSLLARVGYERLTIEAVASLAGVGKQTIYRWWPSKAAVVMDSFANLAEGQLPLPDTGATKTDLRELLRATFAVLTTTAAGDAAAGLLVAARADPDVAQTFRDRFIEHRREAVRTLLVRGVRRGELREGLNLEVVVDAIYGPMWYRLLVGHKPLDAEFADTLVRELFMGIGATS